MICKDGTNYKGGFYYNHFRGQGKFWTNTEVVEGSFINSHCNGKGKIFKI